MTVLRKVFSVFKYLLLALVFLGLLVWFIAWMSIPKQQTFEKNGFPEDVIMMDQNWTSDIRQQVNFSSFGSRLLPYDIFVNLEHAESSDLIKDPQITEPLGFITQRPAENNPDALPVGFARDEDDNGEWWVGLTCAACHMGQVSYQGKDMFIDGGPGLLNFTAFEYTIRNALESTLNQPEKFQRLAAKTEPQGKTAAVLKEQLVERLKFMDERLQINKVDVPYGYGRLDAFGQIFNAVSATALGMKNNYHSPNAPVSIPVLWGASHLDLVQWNASAPNKNPGPLGQNVTTALAVYGQIDMQSGGIGYKSSVDIANLGYIQQQLYKLKSPIWPEDILGKIDEQKALAGEKLYEQQCVACHEIADRHDPKRKLKAAVIALEEVKTDPQMANNFVKLQSKTGFLKGEKEFIIAGNTFAENTRTFYLVINAAVGAMLRNPIDSISAYLAENEEVLSATLDFDARVYKGRPLNGIWAAGPYLHNGSVPTVYDVLQSQENRPTQFYVGSREIDPVKIGLVSEETENSSLFDTALQGNSNVGHEFGANLTEDERWALIEYLKTL